MRLSRWLLCAGTALSAPFAVIAPLAAQAPAPATLPSGGSVLAGQASIATPAPNQMQITQGSDRAVIGWQSFSIGSAARVDIRQPGAGSVSVQQVQGPDPSRIFGQLSSNGRVVVANPNGVWFGPDAKVDATGIAAAAGRMSGAAIGQFMADGNVRLDQGAAPGAEVVNQGRITVTGGGLAALVGPSARNAGTIEARLGRVQIAGGEAATIDFDGDGLIAVRAAPGALAENTGRISADGGRVRLSVAEAKGVLAGAVNMAGVIEARSIGSDAGGITLGGVTAEGPVVNVASRVDVSGRSAGQRGGAVALLGDQVNVRSSARIDATGAQGGGSIRVGGDARGAAGTRAARTTRVERGATLAADATVAGDGGSVVLWAEEATHFAGMITARGAGSGAGGFAEVSGRLGLDYAGTADLTAASGNWGTLLLDPANITVIASGGTNVIPDPSTPGNVNLNAPAVVAALATADVELVAINNIVINATLTWSTGGTLRLTAGNNVTLSRAVTATGAGGLVIRADADGNGVGAANLNAALSLASGALDAQGASVRVGGGGNIRVGTATGAIRLAATAGDVLISSTSTLRNTRLESDSGAITVTASQDVRVQGAGGNGTWSRIAGGGTVTLTAGRAVELRTGSGTNGDNFARVTAGTGMTVTATRDVIVGTGSGSGTPAFNPSGTSLENASGLQSITAGRHLLVQAGGERTAANVTSGGDQTITTTGRIDVFASGSAAAITAAATQAITAGGGISLRGGDAGFSAAVANTAGDQSITAAQGLSLRGNAGGARITNAGGAQSVAGQSVSLLADPNATVEIVNAGGAQAVNATAGLMQLHAAANAPVRIANTGGAQSIRATTTLALLAAGGTGSASITGTGGNQTIAADQVTLTGAGAAAFITASGGTQAITSAGTLTLAASNAATALGWSEAVPTGTPTPGSASIQADPGAAPGVAAGTANQMITAAAIAFAGAPGAAAIGLQDWRAETQGAGAARFQSVLAGGTELSEPASAVVFALLPPAGPAPPAPGPGGPGGAVVAAGGPNADVNALRGLREAALPAASSEALAAGTGGFTPAGLAETQGFTPASVTVEGEDPASVFANTVLATRVDGLLPPPRPYFTGYVAPPAVAAR